MLPALLLATFLAQAEAKIDAIEQAQAQAQAQSQDQSQDQAPSEISGEVADQFAKTATIYTVLGAGDIWTTELGLRQCSTCYETNPLGWNASSRGSLKIAGLSLSLYMDWWLRRHGHKRPANAVRWFVIALQSFAIGNNLYHATVWDDRQIVKGKVKVGR